MKYLVVLCLPLDPVELATYVVPLNIPIEWTATATGLINDGGWTISNNGNTIRFAAKDLLDESGAENPNTQTSKATTTFSVEQTVQLTATVSGVGKPFETGIEKMTVSIDGVEIAMGQLPELDETPTTCEPVPIEATSKPILITPGKYNIVVDFTITDELYHINVYFQTNLAFVAV